MMFLHIDESVKMSLSMSDLRHQVMTLMDQKYSEYNKVLFNDINAGIETSIYWALLNNFISGPPLHFTSPKLL